MIKNFAAKYPTWDGDGRDFITVVNQVDSLVKKGNPKQLISFLKKRKIFLPAEPWQIGTIMKIGSEYYENHGSAICNSKFKLGVDYYKPVDLNVSANQAYQSLLEIVENHVGVADKHIIRGIARRCFFYALNKAVSREGTDYNLSMCTNLSRNEMAFSELERFGIKPSSSGMKTFDLSG